MREETIARSYAETLFELARRNDAVEEYDRGIETVARLLDENPDFRLFLETPRIDPADKKEVLGKVLGEEIPPLLLNFLRVTVDKRRQRLLRVMAREHHLLVDEHMDRVHVDVTVARELDEDAMAEVGRRLSELLGRDAIPHVRVEPDILGGIVVRAGDVIYDGSLRRRLEGMRRQLMSAPLPEPGELDIEEATAPAT